jgi:hypothetical protein
MDDWAHRKNKKPKVPPVEVIKIVVLFLSDGWIRFTTNNGAESDVARIIGGTSGGTKEVTL